VPPYKRLLVISVLAANTLDKFIISSIMVRIVSISASVAIVNNLLRCKLVSMLLASDLSGLARC
jgi:hypothetical protein